MVHKMNRTTFLTAIFLSLATVAIFSVYLLPSIEAISSFKIEQIESDYVTGLSDSKSIVLPKIFTIQGAIPPAGTTGDTIQPRVVSFNPPNGATGVPLSPVITATFSEPVQVSTVTTSTFQVRDSTGSIVPGRITMSAPNLNAVFSPSSQLTSSQLYSVTITTGVKDLAGNPLVGTKWSFTTAATAGAGATIPPAGTASDTIQPRVVSFNPPNGATGVPLSPVITATFSEPVQPSSVTSSTFQLKDGAGNTMPGVITMGPAGLPPNVAMFRPSSPLTISKIYSVTVTTGVKDLAGNPLVGTKSSFTTATSTGIGTAIPTTEDTTPPKVVSVNPRNGATGVQFSSPITATFSEPVSPSTITPASFYAQALPSHSRIPGMVTLSADGKTAKFQPGAQLPSPWFIIIITPEVRDLKGNAMTTPAVWAVSAVTAPPAAGTTTPPAGTTTPPAGTSGDTTPLRVVSVRPVNGATGVTVTSSIMVIFSEPVQPSTVSTTTFKLTTTSTGGGVGPLQIPSIVNVPGTVTLSADGKTATFRPTQPLTMAKYHYYSLTGVKDLAGNPLTPFPNMEGSFTTASP